MSPTLALPVSGLAVFALLLGACGSTPKSDAASEAGARGSSNVDQTHNVKIRAEASELGAFTIAMTVLFPDRRTFVEVNYDLPEAAHQVVYLLRGKRSRAAELPLEAGPGTELTVLGVYAPDCSQPPSIPLLIVRTRDRSGQEHADGFEGHDSDQFPAEVKAFCRRGAAGHVTGSTQRPDGTFEVRVKVFNSGPGTLALVSEAYEMDGTRWFQASKTIDVMEQSELTIQGEGEGCTRSTPWETGHLTANGKPLTFTGGHGEQC